MEIRHSGITSFSIHNSDGSRAFTQADVRRIVWRSRRRIEPSEGQVPGWFSFNPGQSHGDILCSFLTTREVALEMQRRRAFRLSYRIGGGREGSEGTWWGFIVECDGVAYSGSERNPIPDETVSVRLRFIRPGIDYPGYRWDAPQVQETAAERADATPRQPMRERPAEVETPATAAGGWDDPLARSPEQSQTFESARARGWDDRPTYQQLGFPRLADAVRDGFYISIGRPSPTQPPEAWYASAVNSADMVEAVTAGRVTAEQASALIGPHVRRIETTAGYELCVGRLAGLATENGMQYVGRALLGRIAETNSAGDVRSICVQRSAGGAVERFPSTQLAADATGLNAGVIAVAAANYIQLGRYFFSLSSPEARFIETPNAARPQPVGVAVGTQLERGRPVLVRFWGGGAGNTRLIVPRRPMRMGDQVYAWEFSEWDGVGGLITATPDAQAGVADLSSVEDNRETVSYPEEFTPAPVDETPGQPENPVIALARDAGLPVDAPPAAETPIAPLPIPDPQAPVVVADERSDNVTDRGYIIYVPHTRAAVWVHTAEQAQAVLGIPPVDTGGVVNHGLHCESWAGAGGARRRMAGREYPLDVNAFARLGEHGVNTVTIIADGVQPATYATPELAGEAIGVTGHVVRLFIDTGVEAYGRTWHAVEAPTPPRRRRRVTTPAYGRRDAFRVMRELDARIETTGESGKYEIVRFTAGVYAMVGKFEKVGDGWFSCIGPADIWAGEMSIVIDWVKAQLENPTPPRDDPDEADAMNPETIRQPNGDVGYFDHHGRLQVRPRRESAYQTGVRL